MHHIPKPLVLAVTTTLVLSGCKRKEEPAKDNAQPSSAITPVAPTPSTSDTGPASSGFDVSKASVVNPQSGQVSLRRIDRRLPKSRLWEQQGCGFRPV